MKMLTNGFIAEMFSTGELKEMQTEITRVLKERERKEREKVMRKYQEELDRLLDAIEDDGFYVGIPDWPSPRVAVLEPEEDD